MSTNSISSLLSSLGSGTESLSQLLGQTNSTGSSSTSSSENSAIQDAVNAILNSATNTSGSGIDVTSTVDAILEIDAAPEKTLDAQVAAENAQISALQGLQSDITAFQTSLRALTDFTGDFGGLSVSSSNNNAVSATAANGTAVGTHTISVSHLATTSANYSASFSSPSAQLPTGTLTLQVGTNAAVVIPVDSADKTSTLSGLQNYINSHNLGVTASVITETSGSRLTLESQSSGAAGQITLTDNTSADYSGDFTSASATLSSGSFDLTVGSNSAVTIPVDSADGTNTLAGLASYINSQQNLGVTASVVTTASGARLALVPQNSGAAGVITISNDTTGMGFTSPYNPASPPVGGMSFTDAVDGTDASLTVDGIPVDSAGNTVTGVIPGVTLTLSGLTTSGQTDNPVTLQISPNLTPIATDINNFVSSWNTLIQAVNSGIQTNSSTGAAGTLAGDTSVDFVQQQLLSAISSSMSGNNGAVNLQSIGIKMQDDGTLSVDSPTLNDALQNNFSAVQNLFQSTSGVGLTLQTSLTALTNPAKGALNVDMNGINNEVTDLNTQISDFQLQLQATQTQLTAEYSIINTTLEQLPQTLASINSQLNALNPPSSKA
ncbi:MAG TPA: flagellar filament capping protein FliD [Terriglobia bacterium]|nr:flagellar filament capping protein FliD [Terriglobia bacterium]